MNRGQLLKDLREKKNMSQTEAARHIGVTKQTLYKYEKNIVTNIPYDVIERCSTLYEVSPAYLMGWDENPVDYHIANSKTDELVAIYEGLAPDKRAAFEAYLRYLQSEL